MGTKATALQFQSYTELVKTTPPTICQGIQAPQPSTAAEKQKWQNTSILSPQMLFLKHCQSRLACPRGMYVQRCPPKSKDRNLAWPLATEKTNKKRTKQNKTIAKWRPVEKEEPQKTDTGANLRVTSLLYKCRRRVKNTNSDRKIEVFQYRNGHLRI